MEYKVIKVYVAMRPLETHARLEEEVNKSINQGWVPQGGICVSEFIYYQAMIRNSNQK